MVENVENKAVETAEVKVEVKPEVKPEVKTETKPEVKKAKVKKVKFFGYDGLNIVEVATKEESLTQEQIEKLGRLGITKIQETKEEA